MPTVNPQPAECPHCLEKPLGRSCFQHRGQCAELPQTSRERGVRWGALGHAGVPVCQPQAEERGPSACQSQTGMPAMPAPLASLQEDPRCARASGGGLRQGWVLSFLGLSAHTPKTSHLGQRGLDCTEAVPGQKPAPHSGNLCAPSWVWRRRPI